jgi:predicted phage terminase large subunit-like protein
METAAPYVFAGQYMQRPSPAEGGLFKPDKIETIDAIPAGIVKWIRGWDLASTVDGDYTAGAKLGRLPDGRYLIADMVRLRGGPDERDAAITNTAARDGRAVHISLPQDPGQAGKTQALYLTRALSGYRVKTSPESGNKVTRAETLPEFSTLISVGFPG